MNLGEEPTMRRPRLLHLVTRDERRGAESAALALHETLAHRGWDSEIRALAPGRTSTLDIEPLGPSPLSPEALLNLRQLAGRRDLVVGHGSSTLPACAIALVGSTPFMYVNIGDPRAWQTSARRRMRTRTMLRRARVVVAISEQAASTMRELLHVPPARVVVIPNFRSAQRFAPVPDARRAQIRKKFELPTDAPLVLFVGSLSKEKRPDLAIDAVLRLPSAHLAVVGDGPLAAEVRAHGTRSPRVHVLGSLPRPDELLAAADAVVLSSETEGVPGALIEAGLSGTPAAATRVGYVTEVVVDGLTGRLASPLDDRALASAIDDVLSHRIEYGAAARQHCLKHFDLDIVINQWEAILDSSLLADSKRAASRHA